MMSYRSDRSEECRVGTAHHMALIYLPGAVFDRYSHFDQVQVGGVRSHLSITSIEAIFGYINNVWSHPTTATLTTSGFSIISSGF